MIAGAYYIMVSGELVCLNMLADFSRLCMCSRGVHPTACHGWTMHVSISRFYSVAPHGDERPYYFYQAG